MKILVKTIILLFCTTGLAVGAQKGSYSGFLLAWTESNYSTNNQGIGSAKVDDSGTGYRIQAGYQFNANFALETGYNRYSSVEFSNIGGVSGASGKVTPQSLDVLGKLIMPITSGANVFAKVGVAFAEADGSSNTPAKNAGATFSDEHSFRPIYGLGGSYEFYPALTAEISWLQIPEGGGIRRTDLVGFGLTYFFG